MLMVIAAVICLVGAVLAGVALSKTRDVALVVRCKDCDYAKTNGDFKVCALTGVPMIAYDFCSYGKRRKGDAAD